MRLKAFAQQHGVHDPAAHVLKVAVDAVGAGFLSAWTWLSRRHAGGSRCRRQSPALRWRSGLSAHRQCPPRGSRALARAAKAPHRAGGGAHHHGVAPRPWGNDLDQAIPGRHAGHADGAQVVRQRHMVVSTLRSTGAFGVHHAVFLPAAHAHHLVAHGVPGVGGFPPPRPPCRQSSLRPGAAMRRSSCSRSCGRACGVQAQVVVAHQHLAVGQRRVLPTPA